MNIIIERSLVYLIIVVPFLTLYSCTKPSVIVKIRLSVHLSMVNDRMYGFPKIQFFHCAMTPKPCTKWRFAPTATQNSWFSVKPRRLPNSIHTIWNTSVSYKFVSKYTCYVAIWLDKVSKYAERKELCFCCSEWPFHLFFGLHWFNN